MSSAASAPLSLKLVDPDPWFIEQRIFDLLSSYLQPNSSISSTQAAHTFDSLLPDHRPANPDGTAKETTGEFIWNAWDCVHRIAQQVPHDNHAAHDRLTHFLSALKHLQSEPASIVLPNWGDAPYTLWADLPLFTPPLRELLDRVSPLESDCRNLNAYMARIFRDNVVDLSGFAVRGMNEAHPSNGFGIEISRIWIDVAGEAIWEGCQKNSRSGSKDGLTIERWESWHRRYEELAKSDDVTAMQKEAAEMAWKRMGDIQS